MTVAPGALLPYSVESFLSDDEMDRVIHAIDRYKTQNPKRLQAGSTGYSIHKGLNMTAREIVPIFEPAGRLEVNVQQMPSAVVDIVETAYYRHIEDIRRAYPGALGLYGVTYVEYGVGQYFTPHIDGITNEQIAGFGVTLTDDFEGGDFFVETCGSNHLWTTDSMGNLMIVAEHDASSDWYRNLPKTRWTTRPTRGRAIFYGSALTHGSLPVTKGVLKKVLGFIRT